MPKRFPILFILFILLIVGLALFFLMNQRFGTKINLTPPRYSITFSTVYAKQLGLNVQESYRAFVEDLGVRAVRLPVYWSEIEREQDKFDWQEIDNLISFSENNNVKLTLVVGTKVPRWPECFVPDWAESLDPNEQQSHALKMIAQVVNRYKNSAAIERWQVENEPFFPFGICSAITLSQFQERVDLVRSLDPTRPIQITVSGEISPWKNEARAADILGISMYRLTWNDLFGYFIYPLTPEYYFTRAQFVGNSVERVIVSELQAEPWFPEPIESRSLSQWYQSFDSEMFRKNLEFVNEANLPEVYLWGAEWWYLLKKNGDERLWNVAEEVFDN
ncbi:endo-1,4-beta-xylanase [Candidatus Uhrbacteria bacterium]|nr:endo-1,4-beta-xylanase [Candidatus Uhrbacteria bacterium]